MADSNKPEYKILSIDNIQITQFSVKKLFDFYDYVINFKEPIQFVFGINGIGKTTILVLLKEILKGDFKRIREMPFEEILITVQYQINKENFTGYYKFFRQKKEIAYEFSLDSYKTSGNIDEFREFPNFWIKKKNSNIGVIMESNRNDFKEVVDFILKHEKKKLHLLFNYELLTSNKFEGKKDPTFYFRLFNLTSKINFISSQRLNINPDQFRLFQEKIMASMKKRTEKLKNKVAHMGNISSEDVDEISNTISLEKLKKSFLTTGLRERIKNLRTLVKESKKSEEISIFEEIINEYFINKTLILKRNTIYLETFNHRKIPIDGLSSGEKHLFILFYDCIFDSDNADLVFIDEPEISLHISWQLKLVNTIKKIIKLYPNLKVLIATHSPQIVNNRFNLCISADQE